MRTLEMNICEKEEDRRFRGNQSLVCEIVRVAAYSLTHSREAPSLVDRVQQFSDLAPDCHKKYLGHYLLFFHGVWWERSHTFKGDIKIRVSFFKFSLFLIQFYSLRLWSPMHHPNGQINLIDYFKGVVNDSPDYQGREKRWSLPDTCVAICQCKTANPSGLVRGDMPVQDSE